MANGMIFASNEPEQAKIMQFISPTMDADESDKNSTDTQTQIDSPRPRCPPFAIRNYWKVVFIARWADFHVAQELETLGVCHSENDEKTVKLSYAPI